MTRTSRPWVALALAGLLCAGCGSGAASKAGTRDTGGQTLTKQEKAVRFAECIRAHGVPHFPDPGPDGDYDFGVDVTREVWLKATDACKALQPPGALSSRRTPQQQSAGLRFARCVRAHGVKDFPDPVNGEPLIDTYKIPSSGQPGGMTILDAATQACGRILKAAAGGQG
jgi:hypothetical protein